MQSRESMSAPPDHAITHPNLKLVVVSVPDISRFDLISAESAHGTPIYLLTWLVESVATKKAMFMHT